MAGRTIAIGDIHGELAPLLELLARLPPLDAGDTLLFIGDYLDRGPSSAEVVELVRVEVPGQTPARVVALRGNHEDAWLKARDGQAAGFVLPTGNGCLATLRSFTGGARPGPDEMPATEAEMEALFSGSFFPPEVTAWMDSLPYFHEDEHAIYVHGGLPPAGGRWLHPSRYEDPSQLVWCRSQEFFAGYRGKRVVFGHTPTQHLPQHRSYRTPEDPRDAFMAPDLVGIDTGCGRGGFLTAVELPSLTVYESRDR